MRIHLLAMVALLTAAGLTGCDSAREVRNSTNHANAWGCDQCHGYPPPPFFPRASSSALPAEFPHGSVTGAMCSVCHPTTVLSDGHTLVSGGQHRDGQIEAVYGTPTDALPETATCETCHGVPPTTGDHVLHAVNRGVACTVCHVGFDPETKAVDPDVHMQGKDYIVVAGGTHITKAADPSKGWSPDECSSCHKALGVSDPAPEPQ